MRPKIAVRGTSMYIKFDERLNKIYDGYFEADDSRRQLNLIL